MSKFDGVEFAENPDPRVACALVLDTSSSMSGEPIDALNGALKLLHEELLGNTLARRRAELAIVTFGTTVQTVQEFATVDHFEPPTLVANGSTPMGEAVGTAIDLVERRKGEYKNAGVEYYQPWVFLLTDGYPTDEWRSAATRVAELEERGRLAFFAIGVDGADQTMLSTLSVREAKRLEGLKFEELFLWISVTMSSVAVSKPGDQVSLPAREGWEAGWASV